MAVTDFSTTAASNTSISGINIAENCSPAGINNAIRQLMADVRSFYNSTAIISGNVNISGTWEWQDDVAAVFGNDADASISWVSADSALALKIGSTARIEATSAGADVTGDLTVSNDLAVTGDVSGATASGAMVSTDISADTGSTTKIPSVDAVETYVESLVSQAWVNFNGSGTVSIRASKNVSSITDNGTGDYTVNLTTAMIDANYAVNATSTVASTQVPSANMAAGSFKITTSTSGGSPTDSGQVSAVIYR